MSSRSLISTLIAFVFTFSSILPSQALAATQPAKTEVILIQDAHSDEAAQLGIEKLLQQITSQEKIDFIALEGAWTRLTPEVLEFSRNPETNRKILLHLLKHGEISGADLFAVSHKSKFLFEGVEDKKIYKKYFEILKNVLGQHEKAGAFSQSLRERLMDRSSRELNPKLRDFIRHQELYIEGNLSPLVYLGILKKLFREEFGSELTDIENQIEYPNTLRILALKKLMVSKAAEAEYKKFRASAGPGELREIVEGIWDKKHSFPFSENLKSALSFHMLEEELAGTKLFTEIDSISEKFLEKLARAEKEKIFLKEWHDARLFSKLLKLEISPEDWAKIKEKDFYYPKIDSLYQQAKAFYSGAELRDRVMTKSLIRLIDSRRAKKVILITGGFHTESIRKFLTFRGIQTRVMTPEREIKEIEGFSQFAGKISLNQYRDSILHTSIALPQMATMPKPDAAQPVAELLQVDPKGVTAIRHRVREAFASGKSLGIDWTQIGKKDPELTREKARKIVSDLERETGYEIPSEESFNHYIEELLDGNTYPDELKNIFKDRVHRQQVSEKNLNDLFKRSPNEPTTGLSLGTKSKPSLRVKKPAIDPENLGDLPFFQIKQGQSTHNQFRIHEHPQLENELPALARIIKPGEEVQGMYAIYHSPKDGKFHKSEIGLFLETPDFPGGTALVIKIDRKRGKLILTRGFLYNRGAAINRVYSPQTKIKKMLEEKTVEEKVKEKLAKAAIGKKLNGNGHSLGQAEVLENVGELAKHFGLLEPASNSYTFTEKDLVEWAEKNLTKEELTLQFDTRQTLRWLAEVSGYLIADSDGKMTAEALTRWANQVITGEKTLDQVKKEFFGSIRVSDPKIARMIAEDFGLTEKNDCALPLEDWDFIRIAKENHTKAELWASFAAMQKIRSLAKETGYVVGNGFHATSDAVGMWAEKLRAKEFSIDELRGIFREMAAVQPSGKPRFATGSSLGTEADKNPITWQNLPGIIKERYGLNAQIFHTFFTHDEQLRKKAIIISREERRVHIDVFDQSPEETLTSLSDELKKMRAARNGVPVSIGENQSKPNAVLRQLPTNSANGTSAHSLGAISHTAVEISEGLISPRIAEKSPAAARAFITQLKNAGASPALVAQIETYLSSKTSLDITLKILAAIAKMPEKRPVLNIFTSDQLSEDAIDIIRHLHRFNPQERTVIAITSRISDRMTAKIAAIHHVRIIKPEQIADRIEAFEKEYPGEDAHKMITVNAPQPILDSLSNYSGVNFITPITENAAFKSAPTRDKIGALLAERSVAHLLAYYRGDTTTFEKLGLGGILTPATGHTEFAPRYDLNWSVIASSLGKLVDEWRGIEEMERSA